ncbi:hypothetical protein [Larkinella harenae]
MILGWLLISNPLQAQDNSWAVGFRLGEPTGVNIRKYFSNGNGFDFNIGTYGGLYGKVRKYRQGRFNNVGLAFQGHYIRHGEVGRSQTLHYYYGLGAQVSSRRYFPNDKINQPTNFEKNIGLGGSGIVGLEYFLPQKPSSIFVETGLYAEVVPGFLFFNLQSAIGVRYNF